MSLPFLAPGILPLQTDMKEKMPKRRPNVWNFIEKINKMISDTMNDVERIRKRGQTQLKLKSHLNGFVVMHSCKLLLSSSP